MKNYRVLNKPPTLLIGIECRTSNAPNAGPRDIPEHWKKFYEENTFNKIPNKISNEIVALYCDYEGDHTQPYSLVIGCCVGSKAIVPEGMVIKTIPAGSYAVFRAIGEHPQSLLNTWQEIWATDLKRTYTGDYEVYGAQFFSGIPKEIAVFVAIKSA